MERLPKVSQPMSERPAPSAVPPRASCPDEGAIGRDEVAPMCRVDGAIRPSQQVVAADAHCDLRGWQVHVAEFEDKVIAPRRRTLAARKADLQA